MIHGVASGMSSTQSNFQVGTSTVSSAPPAPLVWRRGFSLQNRPRKRQRGLKTPGEELCNNVDGSQTTVRRKQRRRGPGDFAFVSNWPPKPRKKKCNTKRPYTKGSHEHNFTPVGEIDTTSAATVTHFDSRHGNTEPSALFSVEMESVPDEAGPDPTSAMSYERVEEIIREDYGHQIWSTCGQSRSPASEQVAFDVTSRDSSDMHFSYRQLDPESCISPTTIARFNTSLLSPRQSHEPEMAMFTLGPQILFENIAHRFTVLLDMCEYFVCVPCDIVTSRAALTHAYLPCR